jgi:hypothetical protein
MNLQYDETQLKRQAHQMLLLLPEDTDPKDALRIFEYARELLECSASQ